MACDAVGQAILCSYDQYHLRLDNVRHRWEAPDWLEGRLRSLGLEPSLRSFPWSRERRNISQRMRIEGLVELGPGAVWQEDGLQTWGIEAKFMHRRPESLKFEAKFTHRCPDSLKFGGSAFSVVKVR